MSPISKMLIVAVISAIISGSGVYFLQTQEDDLNVSIKQGEKTEATYSTNQWNELIKSNCELSNGKFTDGKCNCPLEGEQTQDEMYDKSTGYCQSTLGGPSGEAFKASMGLPYGEYAFWQDVVYKQCVNSGGTVSGVNCICPENLNYDTSDGQCKSE